VQAGAVVITAKPQHTGTAAAEALDLGFGMETFDRWLSHGMALSYFIQFGQTLST
jgi:hypothetical protein